MNLLVIRMTSDPALGYKLIGLVKVLMKLARNLILRYDDCLYIKQKLGKLNINIFIEVISLKGVYIFWNKKSRKGIVLRQNTSNSNGNWIKA